MPRMAGPMQGINVVELGVWVAGPATGGIPADWGADVIKIEPPTGDPARMTRIVNAEVDGHRLTDEEIGAFLILLASAGNDTTKQRTTQVMMALVGQPATV